MVKLRKTASKITTYIILINFMLISSNSIINIETAHAEIANPFSEKWSIDLSSYSNVKQDYTSNVMPISADVAGDDWHEIFLSIGYNHDHAGDDEGVVFCIDGHTGNVIWSYFSSNFGSHTCLDLHDLDGDGDYELVATGYHHVVAFHAENGEILWEFTRLNNRQDKPAVILEENGDVFVFTSSDRGNNGIGLQKRYGRNGTLIKQVPGPIHPCHGGLSCADLDGDGSYELICTDRSYGDDHKGLHAYDTDLNLLWSHPTVQCSSHMANIIDVNNDGILDVVAMDQGDGSAGICVVDGSDGSKMTGKWSENLGLYAHYTPAIYDIDKDDHLELITLDGGQPAKVWDLTTWSLEETIWRRDGSYGLMKPPRIGNVMGNEDMEMIFVTHAGFQIHDSTYDMIAYQDDGYDGRADRILIQDIDKDGLNEIISILHKAGTGSDTYSFIQCLDTPGEAPDPCTLSEKFLYSYQRNVVADYVTPLDSPNSAPMLEEISDKVTYIDNLLEFTVYASDPDSDSLYLSVDNLPLGSNFVDNSDGTGVFTWTPMQTGNYENISFNVDDGEYTDTEFINIYVLENSNSEYNKIKKFSICYSSVINDSSNQEFIASHFDVLDCRKTVSDAAWNIKLLNNDITLLGYYDLIFMRNDYSDWDYVNSMEDWFVHDKNGNRINSASYSNCYLMNPDTGWSQYYIDQCSDFLTNNPHYSGIYADDSSLDLVESGKSFNVPYSEFEEGILDNWEVSILNLFNNLKSELGTDMVLPNAWKYTQISQDITQAHCWEHFVHGRVHDIDQSGYGESYTLYAIDTLHELAELGNIISVNCGTKNADSDPESTKRIVNFTLSCFLLAVENLSKSYYSWNFFGQDASNGYHSIMDYEFGSPVNDYYEIEGFNADIYAREFTNTNIIVNIDASTTYNITFNDEPYEIGPRTGLILEKDTPNLQPSIQGISVVTSNPIDTDIGWENFSSTITNDEYVQTIILNITYPDETIYTYTMNSIAGSNEFYHKLMFNSSGEYTYFVCVIDINSNIIYSDVSNIFISDNWDINSDRICTILDLLMINERIGDTGDLGWIREDVNNDGVVSLMDLILASNNYRISQ